MSKEDLIAFLEDIITSCRKIEKYIRGKNYTDFIKEELIVDAVIRNLEIIGEAVKKLPINLRKKYSNIE